MGDMAFMNGLPAAQERITRVLTNISGNMLWPAVANMLFD
jgi:hypothetical protein